MLSTNPTLKGCFAYIYFIYIFYLQHWHYNQALLSPVCQPRAIQYFCPHWILHFPTGCAHWELQQQKSCLVPGTSSKEVPELAQEEREINNGRGKKIKGKKKIKFPPLFHDVSQLMALPLPQKQPSSCCCLCLKMDEEFPARIRTPERLWALLGTRVSKGSCWMASSRLTSAQCPSWSWPKELPTSQTMSHTAKGGARLMKCLACCTPSSTSDPQRRASGRTGKSGGKIVGSLKVAWKGRHSLRIIHKEGPIFNS